MVHTTLIPDNLSACLVVFLAAFRICLSVMEGHRENSLWNPVQGTLCGLADKAGAEECCPYSNTVFEAV